jgi:hypothetical protein
MAHTPGPWEARPNDGQIILNGSNCYDIQEIFNDAGGFNPDDIRLMAAAPVMLTALQEIADGCERRLRKGKDQGDLDTLRVCRTAIATAEGRE